MSADMQTAERRRTLGWLRADVVLLAVVALAILVGLAAIGARGFARPPDMVDGLAYEPLPTATATAEPTPGWWATVPVTATPALAGLPGLPKVSLSSGAGGLQAGEPVAFGVVSCPRADVKITAVTTAGKAGWWNIAGTAAIPNQEYWKGELSPNGQGWTMLYRSNAAVQDGLLIEFNTRTVPRGAYQLRLTAVDRTGNYPEPCVIGVSIR
jgi:hypothetical protein